MINFIKKSTAMFDFRHPFVVSMGLFSGVTCYFGISDYNKSIDQKLEYEKRKSDHLCLTFMLLDMKDNYDMMI